MSATIGSLWNGGNGRKFDFFGSYKKADEFQNCDARDHERAPLGVELGRPQLSGETQEHSPSWRKPMVSLGYRDLAGPAYFLDGCRVAGCMNQEEAPLGGEVSLVYIPSLSVTESRKKSNAEVCGYGPSSLIPKHLRSWNGSSDFLAFWLMLQSKALDPIVSGL